MFVVLAAGYAYFRAGSTAPPAPCADLDAGFAHALEERALAPGVTVADDGASVAVSAVPVRDGGGGSLPRAWLVAARLGGGPSDGVVATWLTVTPPSADAFEAAVYPLGGPARATWRLGERVEATTLFDVPRDDLERVRRCAASGQS